MKEFEGKVVLITGGYRGIGRSAAELFIEAGARVIILDKIGEEFSGVTFHKVDLQDLKSVSEILQGYKHIDVLVNNAGIYAQASVVDTTEDLYDQVMDINLKAPFFVSQQLLPKINRGGSIVNVASGLAVAPEPVSPAYCASKAGLLMLTKCMALYYAREGIRVNAVLPGPIDTPMLTQALSPADLKLYQNLNPMNKIGKAGDVASVIYWLASEKAGFVNGASIEVDGGESTSSIYLHGGDYPSKP